MCNLYSLTTNRQGVLRLFHVSHNRAAAFEPKDAIFPGYAAPVVRVAEDGERELVYMSWGFVLPQKQRATRRVTNTWFQCRRLLSQRRSLRRVGIGSR